MQASRTARAGDTRNRWGYEPPRLSDGSAQSAHPRSDRELREYRQGSHRVGQMPVLRKREHRAAEAQHLLQLREDLPGVGICGCLDRFAGVFPRLPSVGLIPDAAKARASEVTGDRFPRTCGIAAPGYSRCPATDLIVPQIDQLRWCVPECSMQCSRDRDVLRQPAARQLKRVVMSGRNRCARGVSERVTLRTAGERCRRGFALRRYSAQSVR